MGSKMASSIFSVETDRMVYDFTRFCNIDLFDQIS